MESILTTLQGIYLFTVPLAKNSRSTLKGFPARAPLKQQNVKKKQPIMLSGKLYSILKK